MVKATRADGDVTLELMKFFFLCRRDYFLYKYQTRSQIQDVKMHVYNT